MEDTSPVSYFKLWLHAPKKGRHLESFDSGWGMDFVS